MFSYSQSIGRPGTSLPTLYYLSNVYALKLLVPTSTNTKKLIISHWCYFQFELILPHGTMVLKCTPNRRNAEGWSAFLRRKRKLTCFLNQASHVGSSAPLEFHKVWQEINLELGVQDDVVFLQLKLPHGRWVGAFRCQVDRHHSFGIVSRQPVRDREHPLP